eukprot:4103095-Amphidinium_carterae.1
MLCLGCIIINVSLVNDSVKQSDTDSLATLICFLRLLSAHGKGTPLLLSAATSMNGRWGSGAVLALLLSSALRQESLSKRKAHTQQQRNTRAAFRE